jgi:hypothetical protein
MGLEELVSKRRDRPYQGGQSRIFPDSGYAASGSQEKSQMITAASGRPMPNDPPIIKASAKSKPIPARMPHISFAARESP